MTQQENARTLLVEILKDPESFDMTSWYRKSFCGTTACMAGHAALLMGWKPILNHEAVQDSAYWFRGPEDPTLRNTPRRDASDLGQEYLELDDDTANSLFLNASNRLALLILDEAAQGEPITYSMVMDKICDHDDGVGPEADKTYDEILDRLQRQYLTEEERASLRSPKEPLV